MTPPSAGASSALDYRAPAHRRRTPPAPRRVSGPARGRSAAVPARDRHIAPRTAGALKRLSAASLLDRLILGRAWIALLAFALIGVVAMQLVVLKLNTGIGRTLQRQVLLQRENAELGIENSAYSAESRIAPLAAATGMTFAPPGTVHFVASSGADVARAASVLASAAQASAADQPGAGEASGAGATGNASASGASAPPSETASSSEASAGSSSGAGGESGGEASESSAAGGEASASTAATGSPTAAPSSGAAPGSTGAQQTEGAAAAAPTATGGESSASAGGASASAGGTQAGPRG